MNDQQLEFDKVLKYNNKELYEYINCNNNTLKILLENNLDIDSQQSTDININNIESICIEYLIDYNIYPLTFKEVNTGELKTYLTFDKSKENIERVKRFSLLNKQRNISTIFNEPTLLHIAIQNKDFTFAKDLIEAGANINARYDGTGLVTYSSLMYTSTEGQFYAGNKTIFCEALKTRSDDFICYLLNIGIEIEPTLFYQTHPIVYLLQEYKQLGNEFTKEILKDVSWYHNQNIIDELHPQTIKGIQLYLKNTREEDIVNVFNSPVINAIRNIV